MLGQLQIVLCYSLVSMDSEDLKDVTLESCLCLYFRIEELINSTQEEYLDNDLVEDTKP